MSNNAHQHYIRRFVTLGSCVVLFLGIFNLVIDPHDIYRLVRIDGLNANKIMAYKTVRIYKSYAVVRSRPQTVILGTSREELGIDPESSLFEFKPVYNLAMPGASLYELLKIFQHAHAIGPVKMVLLGLEFSFFEMLPSKSHGNFNPSRLFVIPPKEWPFLKLYKTDLLPTLFSLDSTKLSFATIEKQKEPNDFLENGFIDADIMLKNRVWNKNALDRFIESEEVLMKLISDSMRKGSRLHKQYHPYENLREIIEICHRDHVQLFLFIPPTHIRRIALMYKAGFGEALEKWKKKMVIINENAAKQSGRPAFPFWDFTNFNAYTTEEMPRSTDAGGEMKWHWEISHYKKELAELMLQRLFSSHQARSSGTDDFGIRLNSFNIDVYLKKEAQSIRYYFDTHPTDTSELEATVAKYPNPENKNLRDVHK